MNSLGVIETHGLVAAIQAADAACKAASVSIIGYRKVGSGLVSVCLRGEVSAVQAAVENGVAAIVPARNLISSLVIARPEECVVSALSALKGHDALAPVAPVAPPQNVIPPVQEETPPAGEQEHDVKPAGKKGKKAQ